MSTPIKLMAGAILLSVAFSAAGLTDGREQVLDDYKNGLAPGWETKSFAGQTHYTVEKNDTQSYIYATSEGAASGLFYKIEYDPKERPWLKWNWKIDHILAKGNAHSKAGDDYAARLYVVFPSFFFWNTKALNYIWANRLPKGEAVPNSFTANAVMVAVESGPELAGQWVSEKRNIYEDYRRAFGEDPPKVGAIAIMTDTDNTGESASASYGPIIIGRQE